MVKKNIVIIGAGLGGLTAGALLSKTGHKVTLLEQHIIVGGSATTFKRRGGFTVEVGLHEMDSPFEAGPKKDLLTYLGVYDNVEFVKPKEFFKIDTAYGEFVMPEGIENAKMALINRFLEEKQGVDDYFDIIESIAKEYVAYVSATRWQKLFTPFIFRTLFKYRKAALKETLDRLTDNEELKLILIANTQYYHEDISKLSLLYHAVAQYSYYSGGGWYIKGGSQKLSDYLASVITDNGGKIIKKAQVDTIEHSNGNVTGVSYTRKKESFRLDADAVISNASPMQTYKMASVDHDATKSLGISLYTLYLGFSKNLKSVYGEKAYSTFNYAGLRSLDDYEASLSKPIEERTNVFVDYSQIDAGLTEEQKSLGVICGADYLTDWEGLDEHTYKAKKETLTKALIAELEKQYPGISELIEYVELATAKTVQRYLQTPGGTPYGFAPTASQFSGSVQSSSDKLDNLYFVGAWVIGGGFTPAIMSGAKVMEHFKE